MKKINIIIGRFQPFTKGHLKCINYIYRTFEIPTIIIMIETPDNRVDEKHPFSSSFLLPIYNELFRDYNEIEGVILTKSANIVEIGQILYDKGYVIDSWVCGTDRYSSYKRMSEKYKEQAHLSNEFKLIEIKRSNEDISATKVRQSLLNNNYFEFTECMPFFPLKTHLKLNLYNTLRDRLLKVYEKV